jgi:hypothetical protein
MANRPESSRALAGTSRRRAVEPLRKLAVFVIAVCGLSAMMEVIPGPLSGIFGVPTDAHPFSGNIVERGGRYEVISDARLDGEQRLGEVSALFQSDHAGGWKWVFPSRRFERWSSSHSFRDGRILTAEEEIQLMSAFADFLAAESLLRFNPPLLRAYQESLQRPDGAADHWLWWGTLGNGLLAFGLVWMVRAVWRGMAEPRPRFHPSQPSI